MLFCLIALAAAVVVFGLSKLERYDDSPFKRIPDLSINHGSDAQPAILSERFSTPAAGRYVRCNSLFTNAERSFLKVLMMAAGDDYLVFGKIRLADIVAASSCSSRSERVTALNRTARKHVDFALCDKDTLEVRAVVELDDRSHDTAHRQKRDELVDSILTEAGIPVVRFRARWNYVPRDVAEKIAEQLRTPR